MRWPTLFSFLLMAVPALAAEVRTLAGQTHQGELLSVTEKEIKLRAGDKEQTFPAADVIAVEVQPLPRRSGLLPYVQVRLVDGTTLRCQALGIKGKTADLRLLGGIAIQAPLASVHAILCEAQDEKNQAEFEQLLAKKPSQDVLRVASRDGMAVNTFEGFVGDADATGETIQFKTEDETVPVSLARVRGVIFSRKQEERAPQGVCRVIDLFQNVFVAGRISQGEDGYQLATPAGLKVELPRPLVLQFDFSVGKIAYLSDLEPLRVEETPILADLWHYRRDKNLEGAPLSLDRKTYAKGLAVHSRTNLDYDVAGYNLFRCILGIDDQVSGPAHVIVRIEADGKTLYAQPLTSKDKPRALDLKLEGAARLRLVVDYGEDLDLGDHVIFAEARVTK